MPYPYHAIPTLATWQSDSSVFLSIRSRDRLMGTIDSLVAAYHDPTLVAVQRETLFYLRSAILYWLKRINATPKNTAPTGLNSSNLPATVKVSGAAGRTEAVRALHVIVTSELFTQFRVRSELALKTSLQTTYGATNHGLATDQQWLMGAGHAAMSVYLTTAGAQRMYKLRFRNGVAWRWKFATNNYAIFDSTDNTESETNDRKVHFVMNKKGAIYAGFDRNAIWFKHSSLVGGEDSLAAGRMRVDSGVVTHVENDSGHYHPVHTHMINLLNRLRVYAADVSRTSVRRMSDRQVFTAAQVLASPATWPDGHVGW
jgi:hypothetical protein